ncbi:hypothetical protein RKD28_003290 [Streptomyces sp. SAI-229]
MRSNSSFEEASSTPHLVRALLGEVRAPRRDLHAEGKAHSRHPAADPAQSEQAEAAAAQIRADRRLPRTARAQRVVLRDDAAGQSEQQRPGQLHRRGGGALGAADRDAVAFGGGVVDDRVAHAGRDEQPQPGEPVEQGGGKRDAFPQRHRDVEVREHRGQFVLRGEVLGEGGHLHAVVEGAPVGDRGGDVLEVVEHGTAKPHVGPFP